MTSEKAQNPYNISGHSNLYFPTSQSSAQSALHSVNQSMHAETSQSQQMPGSDEYEVSLTVRVESHERNSYSLPLTIKTSLSERGGRLQNSGSVIHFKITDEQNPGFLYVCDISNEDYLRIKDMNRLLIDDLASFYESFLKTKLDYVHQTQNYQFNQADKIEAVL